MLANRSRNESIAKKRGGGINWNTDTSMQLRRQARLRREYLYRKSQEDQEKSILERKRKLRDAVEGVCDIHKLDHIGNHHHVIFVVQRGVSYPLSSGRMPWRLGSQ